ncbi:MAG: hypothetical protein NT018_03430 [Armatimonadetes bacterium]|nr:hypothetical protein [Armatimonadota bacterium]
MEKLTYEEAREWFWIRTLIWFFPAIIVSIAGHFAYCGEILTSTAPRLWVSVSVGIVTVMLGVFSAFLSMQFPWMSAGRWFAFLLTGPICAGMCSGAAFVLGGLTLAFIKNNPINIPDGDMLDIFYKIMIFAIGASGFWGLVFGVWFALRRDRYFVEII